MDPEQTTNPVSNTPPTSRTPNTNPPVNQDGLTKQERLIIWLTSIFGSILVGAIAYYVWRKSHPKKARQANTISWIVFLVLWVPLIIWHMHTRLVQIESQTQTSIYEAPSAPILTVGTPENNLAGTACAEDADQNADRDYDVKHTFQGSIKAGEPITMTLSCDRKTLTITGSINQVITYDQIAKAEGTSSQDDMGFNSLLIEGSDNLDMNNDYNFDGYADLESLYVNGQGWDGIQQYNIFLFDPAQKQFVYNHQLSQMTDVRIDGQRIVDVVKFTGDGNNPGDIVQYYKWVNGGLVKDGGPKAE